MAASNEWEPISPVSVSNDWEPISPVVDDRMMGMGFNQQNPSTVPEAGYVTRKHAIEQSGIDFSDEPFPTMVRADLESSKHNPEEVAAKFFREYPKGDLRTLDVEGLGPIYFGKQGDEDKFRLLNPVGLDKSDIAPLLAESPEIAGSILAAVATGGRSIPIKSAADFLGPVIGDILKETSEYFRGVQRDSGSDIAKRAAFEGALNVAGGRGADIMTGGVNLTRKGSVLDDQGKQVMRSVQEEGLPRPAPDLVSDNAVIVRFGAQSRQASEVLPTRDAEVQYGIIRRGQEMVGEGGPEAGRELRDNIIPGQLDAATAQQTSKLPQLGDKDFWYGGVRIREGVTNYIEATKTIRDKLYENAIAKAPNGVMLRIDEPKAIADDLLEGITGIVGGEAETVLPLRGELSRIAKSVSALDNDQPFETIKKLRSELFELKTASRLSGHNRVESQANSLYMSLTRAMDNPVGQYDPAFTNLYKKARTYNWARERRIEQDVIQSAANTQNPAILARSLAQPGQFENLAVLRKSMTNENWSAFKESFKRDLLFDAQQNGWTKPNSIGERIAQWKKDDPRGLRSLISPEEERMYVRIGDELNKIANSQSAQVLDELFEGGKIAYRLIYDKGPDEMRKIIAELGGKGSEGHKLLKESLSDYLFTSSVRRDTKTGRLLIDSGELTSKVQGMFSDMRVRGVLEELFSPEELKKIKNLELVQSIFKKGTSDAGASLEVAQDISSLKNITRGDVIGTLRGAHGLWFNRVLGRTMLSNSMQRVLLGSGKSPLSGTGLRAMTTAIIQARDSIEQMSGDVKSDMHDKWMPKFRDFMDKYSNYSVRG